MFCWPVQWLPFGFFYVKQTGQKQAKQHRGPIRFLKIILYIKLYRLLLGPLWVIQLSVSQLLLFHLPIHIPSFSLLLFIAWNKPSLANTASSHFWREQGAPAPANNVCRHIVNYLRPLIKYSISLFFYEKTCPAFFTPNLYLPHSQLAIQFLCAINFSVIIKTILNMWLNKIS